MTQSSMPIRELINPVARALHDNETWTVDDTGEYHATIPYSIAQSVSHTPPQTFENRGNKREETYNKMSEREMVPTGLNPFLTDISTVTGLDAPINGR